MRPSLASSCRVFVAFASLLFAVGTQAAVISLDTFDTDAEGWTGLSCQNPGLCALSASSLTVQHQSSAGNPGGYIRTLDPGPNDAARLAPPAAFSSLFALGQTLSFDVLVESHGGGGKFDSSIAPLVAIETSFGTLFYVTIDFPEIDGDWKHYDVPLSHDANWLISTGGNAVSLTAGQFNTAFGARSRLTIISEWLKEGGEVDTGGLDNIQLSAVPVPAALPLLFSALGVLGYRRRRRQP